MTLRELCMMPRLVNLDYGTDAAQKGAVINVPIPSAQTATPVVPGPVPPAPTDNTILTTPIVLGNWYKSNFGLTDKDMMEIDARANFIPMQAMEAIRAIANIVNAQLFGCYKGQPILDATGAPTSSYSPGTFGYTGTPGVTPFGASDADAVQLRKVLSRQMAPKDNRRAVLTLDAEANALSLPSFKDVSQSGENTVKINGEVGRKFGIDWYADDIVPTHTAGTGAGWLVDHAGDSGVLPTGTKNFLIKSGSGTPVVGDIFTFAGATGTYVVTAYSANTISIYPGIGAPYFADAAPSKGYPATVADGVALTFIASHVVNLGFHRDAFACAIRPLDNSMAQLAGAQVLTLTDPDTGISLRLEVTRQYKQVSWEYDILWGGALVRPELAARLVG